MNLWKMVVCLLALLVFAPIGAFSRDNQTLAAEANDLLKNIRRGLDEIAGKTPELSFLKKAELSSISDPKTDYFLGEIAYRKGVRQEPASENDRGDIAAGSRTLVAGDGVNFYVVISSRPLKLQRTDTWLVEIQGTECEIAYFLEISSDRAGTVTTLDKAMAEIVNKAAGGRTVRRLPPPRL